MTREPVDLKASVTARLRNIASEKKSDFQLVLRRYAIERLLYRLSVSEHRERFVLKGAMLFTAWVKDPFRATKDLDLLGRDKKDVQAITETFKAVCQQKVKDDGLTFDPDTLRIENIHGQQEEGGLRVKTTALLAKIQIPVQIDIGFGDAITPDAVEIEFPPLLDAAAPMLKAYPKETVVAEKFQAIVALGHANSRMKDFYDLVALSRLFAFDGKELSAALAATFNQRGTELPADRPIGLSTAFASDKGKIAQWSAFTQREPLGLAVGELAATIEEIASFIMPAANAAHTNLELKQVWSPGGPWKPKA